MFSEGLFFLENKILGGKNSNDVAINCDVCSV